MEPLFDEFAKQAFTAVSNLHAVGAVWHSSEGAKVEGRVLHKNPTEPVQKIGDSEQYEYRPSDNTAEYYEGTFPGLKQAVDEGKEEYLEIAGRMYHITDVSTKFDGKTYVTYLEPHEA